MDMKGIIMEALSDSIWTMVLTVFALLMESFTVTQVDPLYHPGCLKLVIPITSCWSESEKMRFFAQYNNSGKLLAIGTGNGGEEITEAEYNALLAEIREKAAFVNKLYSGEITIDEVPADWQEEIQRRVDERIAAEGTAEEQDIPAEEVLDILLGGATWQEQKQNNLGS